MGVHLGRGVSHPSYVRANAAKWSTEIWPPSRAISAIAPVHPGREAGPSDPWLRSRYISQAPDDLDSHGGDIHFAEPGRVDTGSLGNGSQGPANIFSAPSTLKCTLIGCEDGSAAHRSPGPATLADHRRGRPRPAERQRRFVAPGAAND
jgi:hypothetical protein